jgi:pimeloyl-ACP methyl ester carboxylesterase/DNA-binding CsgD family transcriptional regulator
MLVTKMNNARGKYESLADLHEESWSRSDLKKYDSFMETFRDLIGTYDSQDFMNSSEIGRLETYSENAIKGVLNNDGPSGTSLFSKGAGDEADYCSIITDKNGTILEANSAVNRQYNIQVRKTLEQNKIECFGGLSFAKQFSDILRDSSLNPEFRILQVTINESEVLSTLAVKPISHAKSLETYFLVVFLTPPNTYLAAELVAKKFGLSNTETQISAAIIAGQTLREISELRGRSYKTIRNQFQQILEKTNTNSHQMFMRLINDLTFLLLQEKKIQQAEAIKGVREIEVPRPRGRIVEVQICGDEHGTPLVSLPALFGHGITDYLSKMFYDRGVFYISISRPGYGKTSKTPRDQTVEECILRDFNAVMNVLEIDECVIMGRAASSQSVYNLLIANPNKFIGAMILGGMVPRKYFVNKTIKSKWTEAVMAVSSLSKPISRLLLATGHRLLLGSDPVRFLDKMYSNSPSDCAVFRKGNTAETIRQSCIDATVQGIDAGVHDMVDGFKDWDDDLAKITVPVTLLHGIDDGNIPLSAVREFANFHSNRMKLIEFNPGGGQLFYSHMSEILDVFLNLAERKS